MTCRCGESQRTQALHSFRRTVAGTTFTAEASVDACARCAEPTVPAALVIAFERALAAELARRGPISGETFRWIRKAASIERMDFAHLVGIPVETIASWEEERRAPDVAAWTIVASMALDAIEGPRPMRTRLKARPRGGPAPQTARLELGSSAPGTLAKVLEILSRPMAFTDADIADSLDVDCAALRARLRSLASLGLVQSPTSNGADEDGVHWELVTRDRSAVVRTASDAGVDLDAMLPRAKRPDAAKTSSPRERTASVNWRASS
jgi:DNA-binding transcriptional regulator YiaG